ncbi:hypothetical protein ACQ4PT_006580 [Festuca glaucescens]
MSRFVRPAARRAERVKLPRVAAPARNCSVRRHLVSVYPHHLDSRQDWMGDPSIDVSEEKRDQAQLYKKKGVDALSEGKLNEAIEHLTEAILLNPTSAILYATRGIKNSGLFIKMKKPNAATRDADAALQDINHEGWRKLCSGSGKMLLMTFHVAAKLDFDEEISAELKKVEPNVHKIEEHKKKYERLRKERDMKKADTERKRKHAEETETRLIQYSNKLGFCCFCCLKDGDVITIHSSNEFEAKLKAASSLSRLVILYFTATWCGPCRFMGPVYKSLAEKHRNIVFLMVDIDELGNVAHRWNVTSVPTFSFVINGKVTDKVVGADKTGLERKLAQYGSP